MKRETKPMERMSHEPLALRLAPRCSARTRSGTLCQKPAAKGKKRCRLHGGAEGSGAPRGDRNGSYRHGLYTREAIAERQALRALIRGYREDARGALRSHAKPSQARS
jgi:glucans biosynthesis protein